MVTIRNQLIKNVENVTLSFEMIWIIIIHAHLQTFPAVFKVCSNSSKWPHCFLPEFYRNCYAFLNKEMFNQVQSCAAYCLRSKDISEMIVLHSPKKAAILQFSLLH